MAPSDLRFFHGGIPDLKPGDLITPSECGRLGCFGPTLERRLGVRLAPPALPVSRLRYDVQVLAVVRMALRAVRLGRIDRREGVSTPRRILAIRRRLKVGRIAAKAVPTGVTPRAIRIAIVARMVHMHALRQRTVLQLVEHAMRGPRALPLDVDLPVAVAAKAPCPRPARFGFAPLDGVPKPCGEVFSARLPVVAGVPSAVPSLVVRLAVALGLMRSPTVRDGANAQFHASSVLLFLRLEVTSKYPLGDLYVVEPVGDVEPSTEDHFPTWTTPAARVVSIYDRAVRLTPHRRRTLMNRWAAADAAALLGRAP